MANYKLEFKASVAKDLRSIPKKDVKRILNKIETLVENPRPVGSQKLTSQEKYRIRQGAYRIIYEILDSKLIVLVVKAGHRREIYKDS